MATQPATGPLVKFRISRGDFDLVGLMDRQDVDVDIQGLVAKGPQHIDKHLFVTLDVFDEHHRAMLFQNFGRPTQHIDFHPLNINLYEIDLRKFHIV